MTQHRLFETELVSGLPSGSGAFTTTELPTRALTLYQPWAWLVAHGHKPLENRPPRFSHKSFTGWFWIHAGLVRSEDEWHTARALGRTNGFDALPALDDPVLHYGAIIGRARVVGALPVATLKEEFAGTWRMQGRFSFILLDATPLRTPVPCRGYQGFWRVTTAVLAELRKAA